MGNRKTDASDARLTKLFAALHHDDRGAAAQPFKLTNDSRDDSLRIAFEKSGLNPKTLNHWRILLGAFADAHFGKRKPGRPKTWDDDGLLRDYVALFKQFVRSFDAERQLFTHRIWSPGELLLSLPKYKHLKARTIERRLREALKKKTKATTKT
jgi:hypothetical protein